MNLWKIKSFKLGKLVFAAGCGFNMSYLGIRCSFQPEYYDHNGKQYNAKALMFEVSFLQKRYYIGILIYGKEVEFINCRCECNKGE